MQLVFGGKTGISEVRAYVRRQSTAAGGKVPLPSAPANAPPGGVRRQGAAAECARQCPSGGACGGKVPLPGARSTPFGVARRLAQARLWQALPNLLRGAQIRPQGHLRGAQQARQAPRTAARCRCRVRTPMPLRGACGQPIQASIGRLAKPFTILGQITIYAAHK